MGRQPGRQLMRGAILTAIAVLVGSQTVDAAAATSGSQLRSAPKALLLAQVGSTGGSIGKQDKSLSGDRPQSSSPAAEQPRRSPSPEKRPAAASGRGNYDGVGDRLGRGDLYRYHHRNDNSSRRQTLRRQWRQRLGQRQRRCAGIVCRKWNYGDLRGPSVGTQRRWHVRPQRRLQRTLVGREAIAAAALDHADISTGYTD